MGRASAVIGWAISGLLVAAGVAGAFVVHAELEQKDRQLAELVEKYNALANESNRRLEEFNKRIKESSDRYDDVVHEANQKIEAAALPEIDLHAEFRKNVVGNGYIASLKNKSGRTVVLSVSVARPTTGASRAYELIVDEHESKEIGEHNGWAFVPGDQITVEQSGHKSKTYTLN